MPSERESRRERRLKRKEKRLHGAGGSAMGQTNAGESATFQGVDELAEMDDWGSAWQEAKEKGEGWGGRGKGGRGIQRNTWQPKDIYVEGVTLAYQGTELLERTTLRLGHGRRYGLVGANGIGKTTLLRRIAAGAVPGWPLHLRSYLVQQEEMAGSPVSNALETVMAADSRITILQREAELLEADAENTTSISAKSASLELPAAVGVGGSRPHPRPRVPPSSATSGLMRGLEDAVADMSMEEKVARLEEVYEDLDALDAHDAEGRATSILKGLGFSATRMSCPTCELSGGWMTRVSLACALYCRPDLLLLDEPTNHLDLEGVVWLSKQLTGGIGDTMVLMVSHDAAFIDAVVTDVIHFQLKQLSYYAGDYSAFMKTKSDHDVAANRTQVNLDRQRKHIEDSVKKMTKAAGGKAGDQKKSGQVASRNKKLERHGLERDVNGHRWKAQTVANTGSSIRAGCANELTFRGGKTARRSLAAHVDKETVFKFPDVAPLSCAMDAPIVQCRGVSFSFPSATATAAAAKLSSSSLPSATKTKAPARVGAPWNKEMPSKGTGKNARGIVHITAGNSAIKPRTRKVDSSPALLEGVTLDLTRKSRVVLVGRNGSGKSTLLRLIAAAAGVGGEWEGRGEEGVEQEQFQPTEGSIVRNHNARVGLFTQHHAEKLRMSDSPLQHMQRVFQGTEGVNEAELRRQLGCCGICGSLALQEMRSLSGGQKSRVVLAELMTRRPHVLLMDEPTNHLDLPSIEALKNALHDYGGGIVLASHDQALISDMLTSDEVLDDGAGHVPRGELWEVKGHRVRRREGGIDEYLEEVSLLTENREARRRAAA